MFTLKMYIVIVKLTLKTWEWPELGMSPANLYSVAILEFYFTYKLKLSTQKSFLSRNHRKVYMQKIIVTLVIIADDLVEITFQKFSMKCLLKHNQCL